MRFGNLNDGMSQDLFIKLIQLLDKYVCVFADTFSYFLLFYCISNQIFAKRILCIV